METSNRGIVRRIGLSVWMITVVWTGLLAAQTRTGLSPSIGIGANAALGGDHRTLGPGFQGSLLARRGRFGYGVEAGYQGLGTAVTTITNFDNRPGYVYREEIRRSMIRVVALTRLELGGGAVRPFLTAGGGGYNGRFKDHIEVLDSNGIPIPFYDFEGSGSDLKPGLTGGIGLALTGVGRRLTIEFESRWHGIIDVGEAGFGTANFLSIGLAVRW